MSCEDCAGSSLNNPPIARAGLTQTIVLPTDSVFLDGSTSFDPDGSITSYQWLKISGPPDFSILNPDSTKTIVKALEMGVYHFELTVKDNGGLYAKDTVQIIVDDPSVNQPPFANAGTDQTITLPTDSAILNGILSFDPDGTIVSYQWTKISGPNANNILSQTVQTKVDGLVQGVYQFELKITDNGGLFTKDTMQVVVVNPAQNQPPIACAGPDQVITLPNIATLNGSCSADPDNNITSYSWTKISGPTSYSITNINAVQTAFTNLEQGIYQVELKVTDAGGLFSKDTVRVTVNGGVTNTCSNLNRPFVNAQLIPIGQVSQTRGGMSVASSGNKIFFAGGVSQSVPSSRVDIYDIGTNTWSTAELCAGRYLIAIVAAGNKIFFGGGETLDGTWPVDSVDIYNISTNNWSVAHLSTAGNGIVAATVGNKVFFAGGDGGFSGNPDRSSTVDIYDLISNTWSTASLGSEGKEGGHSAVAVNNKLYISGGGAWSSNFGNWFCTKRIDIYDNTTNSWSTSSLDEGKLLHAGIAVNGKIYWAGGYTGSNPTIINSCSVEIKDINTGSVSIQQLSAPLTWSSTEGQAAVAKDGKIIFMGYHQPVTNKFDIYDIATNSWSIGILPFTIDAASIISINNTVFVAGGFVNGVLSNQLWKLEF